MFKLGTGRCFPRVVLAGEWSSGVSHVHTGHAEDDGEQGVQHQYVEAALKLRERNTHTGENKKEQKERNKYNKNNQTTNK